MTLRDSFTAVSFSRAIRCAGKDVGKGKLKARAATSAGTAGLSGRTMECTPVLPASVTPHL